MHEDGAWTLRNVGASDRLYSATFCGDRLFVGGIATVYEIDSSATATSTSVGASVNVLHRVGGLIIGAGGSNPASGRLAYSPDGTTWTTLDGPALPSLHSLASRGRSVFFVGSSTDGGVIGRFDYSPPPLRLSDTGQGGLQIAIRRSMLGTYTLYESSDLLEWVASPLHPTLAPDKLTWSSPGPGEGAAKFFRVEVE
jgi:hypothetical protein